MEQLVTGITAALLTLFDLDRTFYVPARVNKKLALYTWWFGFILINAALAVLFYEIVGDTEALNALDPYLKAVIFGIGYLALVRLKFATFNFQGSQVPFGLEAFYDAAKAFVFRRINSIAIQARRDETSELAASMTFKGLAEETKFAIDADMLLSAEERASRRKWLLKILQDAAAGEDEKKITLANYIKSGQMIEA
jgi:hypothetical protein